MKLSGDRNQCPSCQELFNSSSAFDRHRVGSYSPMSRRCLSIPEMELKGMVKNTRGYWGRMAFPTGTIGQLRGS